MILLRADAAHVIGAFGSPWPAATWRLRLVVFQLIAVVQFLVIWVVESRRKRVREFPTPILLTE